MGTTYTIKINKPDLEVDLLSIKTPVDHLLDNINVVMSTYLPDSELSRFNQSDSTDWIKVSDELFEVIQAAIEIGQSSDGAFDITVGPLVNLWGFGPVDTRNKIPDEESLASVLANVNFRYVHLDHENRAIRKDRPGVYLDLSGIAKGYAVDRVALWLEQEYAVKNYMVEIGGEIRAKGHNPDGQAWRIGIELPLTDTREAGRIINLDNIAMATSGDYRNYYEVEGVEYSHTINPRTGRPVTHRLDSVTVIHSQCMLADAWATALLVDGPEAGMALANRHGLAALFIIRDKNGFAELASDRLRTYLDQSY